MEARPGDEGRDEIVLTSSNLNMEEQKEKPELDQAHLEKPSTTKNQKKAEGRPVHLVQEALQTTGQLILFSGGDGSLSL